MITTKALSKFSRSCSFFHHRNFVPMKPILDGATTNDMAPTNSFLKGVNDTREAVSWSGQTRRMPQRGFLNHSRSILGWNSMEIDNVHDALRLPSRHFSTYYNDKLRRESTNKLFSSIPEYVKIVEVGPRDGLQNEKDIVPTAVKVELIKMLASSGLPVVEATSFVSPKWVPQLADAKDVMEAIRDFKALFSRALKQLLQMEPRKWLSLPLLRRVSQNQTSIAALKIVLFVIMKLPSLPASFQFLFVGTVIPMLEAVIDVVPIEKLAVHFHDTYGQALSNILASLQMGISTVDSSVSGLGGCPYAKGASGNVATEDVVYMLNGLGVKTNVDLQKIMLAGNFIRKHLGHSCGSKTAIALSKITAHASKL
ncbi:hydroxymethylglutaryl-CoA lyase, mitochondrial-like isoform X2 [Populus nigra]|uniref:hydroxymethylglutaryl-CoA lyase, mitochondrial-like isoform X2 n=1 Tax=Populus nigra TaxID=3691 RepID=UPI002B26E256|nr:hydroxymethylglutaryl-CoA lyase, mitochondrial-like isoform X2 [Populus nigra]